MQSTQVIAIPVGGQVRRTKDRGEKKKKKKELVIETPQGQSDTGRNPKPPLVPEPIQEHNTKAPFPSKIRLNLRGLATITPRVY